MTPAERIQLRISIELARWVVSSVIGLCCVFWSVVIAWIVSPEILHAPFKSILTVLALEATLVALLWYAIVAQHWTLESRPPR